MAIQFACPHCAAEIKVPDAAAGKTGSCPTCQTKLVVPVPAGMPTPSGSAPPPQPAAPPPAKKHATGGEEAAAAPPKKKVVKKIIKKVVRRKVVAPPTATEDGTAAAPPPPTPAAAAPPPPPTTTPDVGTDPALDFAVDDAAPVTAATDEKPERKKRKRRKKSRISLGLIVPIVCGAVLLVALAFWYLDQSKAATLTGTLEAELVSFPAVDPEYIAPQALGVPSDLAERVVDRLKDRPVQIKTGSRTMDVIISAEDRGVKIEVARGMAGRWYRFAADDAALRDYVKQHRSDWDKLRNRHREKAASAFVKAVDKADASGENLSAADSVQFRDRMALATTVGGLGYVVEAKSGTAVYRCAYEDTAGRLYFLLPGKVKNFRVRGRKVDGEGVLFQGDYLVKVIREVEGEAKPEPGAGSPEDDDIAGLGERGNNDDGGSMMNNDDAPGLGERKE